MERDRAIMEHTADALFVYDLEGRIFDVNRLACDTLGYTQEELLTLSITDVETVLLPGGFAGLWRRWKKGKIGTKYMILAYPRVAEAGVTSGYTCASASERRGQAGREQGPIRSERGG